MVSVHYERVRLAFIILAACAGQAWADTLTDDYKKLTAISNQYLFETNDVVKADVAWIVQRNLETYEPAMLATMGLPGESKKYFVFVEVPSLNKVADPGLGSIRVTVFDYWRGSEYTPMGQREFMMDDHSRVVGIQVEPPDQGLGEVLAIHACRGGSSRRPVLATTYWTLERPHHVPECRHLGKERNLSPLPVFRQISEKGGGFEICFRRYSSAGEAACYNPDGFSPEEWGRNVTNPCVSLKIRSLYELGCYYDFVCHRDDPRDLDMEKRMSEVRNSLLRDGTIGNLATNDPNPFVREHAQRLLEVWTPLPHPSAFLPDPLGNSAALQNIYAFLSGVNSYDMLGCDDPSSFLRGITDADEAKRLIIEHFPDDVKRQARELKKWTKSRGARKSSLILAPLGNEFLRSSMRFSKT